MSKQNIKDALAGKPMPIVGTVVIDGIVFLNSIGLMNVGFHYKFNGWTKEESLDGFMNAFVSYAKDSGITFSQGEEHE